jgi:hypothetical protein
MMHAEDTAWHGDISLGAAFSNVMALIMASKLGVWRLAQRW